MYLKRMSLTLVILCSSSDLASSSPEIRVVPSRNSVQKGGVFDLRLEITARETLNNIVVSPLIPFGFRLDPLPTAGIEVVKGERTIKIASLGEGSSIAVPYRGWPPSLSGKPRDDAGPGSASTSEQKTFVFNVFYAVEEDSTRLSASQSVTIQYTTSFGYYLFWGLVGMLLGHVVKNGTRQRETLQKTMTQAWRPPGTWSTATSLAGKVLRSLLGTNITGLVTILVVGFGVLLVLGRDGIPIAGWHQAVALGFGLAVLTDDELLAKFTVR